VSWKSYLTPQGTVAYMIFDVARDGKAVTAAILRGELTAGGPALSEHSWRVLRRFHDVLAADATWVMVQVRHRQRAMKRLRQGLAAADDGDGVAVVCADDDASAAVLRALNVQSEGAL